MLRCLPLLALTLALGAAQTPGDLIEQAVATFERDIERAYQRARRGLDRYRDDRVAEVVREIETRMRRAEGDDRRFLAYRLLRFEPDHDDAIAAFGEDGSPIAPSGGLRASVSVPAPSDPELAVTALGWQDFPRDEVIDVTRQVLKRFASGGKDRASRELYTTLLALRKAHPKLVKPVLGFYFPGKDARGRGWIPPVDQHLLRDGLVTTELAYGDKRFTQDTSERLPMALPGVRLELATVSGESCRVRLHSPGERGLELAVTPERVRVLDGEEELATHDGAARTVEFDLRQRHGLLSVDGRPVDTFELERAMAVDRMVVVGGSSAHILRLRFLGPGELIAPEQADIAAAIARPAPSERAAIDPELLARTVTLSAEDQPTAELLAAIATISGVELRLAPSAEAFGEIPLSLEASAMPLEQVLAWLRRSLDLQHHQEGTAIVLTWGG